MKKLFITTIALLSVMGLSSCGYADRHNVTTRVNDKERVCDQNECKYLVFTDEGTYKISDSLVLGRWDSSDVYGRVKEGKTYEITYYGWRIPFFSQYPNIEDLKEVDG